MEKDMTEVSKALAAKYNEHHSIESIAHDPEILYLLSLLVQQGLLVLPSTTLASALAADAIRQEKMGHKEYATLISAFAKRVWKDGRLVTISIEKDLSEAD